MESLNLNASHTTSLPACVCLCGCQAAEMATVALLETPTGKDAIAEGLLDLLKPAVQQLDLHVHSVR